MRRTDRLNLSNFSDLKEWLKWQLEAATQKWIAYIRSFSIKWLHTSLVLNYLRLELLTSFSFHKEEILIGIALSFQLAKLIWLLTRSLSSSAFAWLLQSACRRDQTFPAAADSHWSQSKTCCGHLLQVLNASGSILQSNSIHLGTPKSLLVPLSCAPCSALWTRSLLQPVGSGWMDLPSCHYGGIEFLSESKTFEKKGSYTLHSIDF